MTILSFEYQNLIASALKEDLGNDGDITTKALFDADAKASAIIKSKQHGILSGAHLIAPIFSSLDPAMHIALALENGTSLGLQSKICTLTGNVHAILAGERLALNFLQHLSGVATATNTLMRRIAHTKAKLLDTRKTTPLLRKLEKEAVVHGGGVNHRFGLFDMILIKDTHVKAAGGPAQAAKRALSYVQSTGSRVAIEVEIQSVEEFSQVIGLPIQRIMLDNMSVSDMKTCVDIKAQKKPHVELEASGNVSAETIVSIAETGVDFISVGAITHSVKALDIHLVIE